MLHVTYKFFRNWEVIEQLHTAKVITSGQCCARVVEMGSVDICLVSILWPHTDYLLPEHTVGGRKGGGGREVREEGRRGREAREDQQQV